MRTSRRSSSTTSCCDRSCRESRTTARPSRRNLHVLVAQRRQTVGLVRARVLFVADADQRLVEQAHDHGEHLVLRQPGQREILLQAPAQPRQLRAEIDHARELAVVARRAPLRRDSDTACADAHRDRSPADVRAARGRSTRRYTRAESRAGGSVERALGGDRPADSAPDSESA